MKTTINLLRNEITLESVYMGVKHSLWSKENTHTHHTIMVTHNDNTIEFDYWASLAQPTIENENDLVSAFYSFLLDNVSEYTTYEDFLSEYGYEDNDNARNTYEGCLENTEKLSELEILEEHYELIEELQNQYDL